jgi:hypothetical protein
LRALAEAAPAMPLETLLPQVLSAAGILDWAARMPEAAQAHADLMRLSAGLCCTNPMRDSLFESRVVADSHEQLVPYKVQDEELAFV